MSEPQDTLTPKEIAVLIEEKLRLFSQAQTRMSQAPNQVFEHQADALVDMSGGTPPVSGTKYEWSTDGSVANAIGTQKNVRLITVVASVTWTVQPTPLEIHITIDGVTTIMSQIDPVSTTEYYANVAVGDANLSSVGIAVAQQAGGLRLEGRSVKVEFETTGGTVSALSGRVKWAQLP